MLGPEGPQKGLAAPVFEEDLLIGLERAPDQGKGQLALRLRKIPLDHLDQGIVLRVVDLQLRRLVPCTKIPDVDQVHQPGDMVGMSMRRFMVLNVTSAFIWSLIYIGAGYVFGQQIELIEKYSSRFGLVMSSIIIIAVGVLVYKYKSKKK